MEEKDREINVQQFYYILFIFMRYQIMVKYINLWRNGRKKEKEWDAAGWIISSRNGRRTINLGHRHVTGKINLSAFMGAAYVPSYSDMIWRHASLAFLYIFFIKFDTVHYIDSSCLRAPLFLSLWFGTVR